MTIETDMSYTKCTHVRHFTDLGAKVCTLCRDVVCTHVRHFTYLGAEVSTLSRDAVYTHVRLFS